MSEESGGKDQRLEQVRVQVAPVEAERNAELLSRERAGLQAVFVCDAFKPGQGSLGDELDKVKEKIDKGESLDAVKSTNASKKIRHDYWNGDDADYNNKTLAEQHDLFRQQKDKWLVSADTALDAFKNDPQQAAILNKLGITQEKGAIAFYKDFFEDHKGDIGYLEGLIGKGFTRDDVLNAQKEIAYKIIDPKTGKEVDVRGSLFEVVGRFYGVDYSEIKDMAEGVINIRENYSEFKPEAVKQVEKGLEPEVTARIDQIHSQSEGWKEQMSNWEEKAKAEEAERERVRKEAAAEAERKRAEEAKERELAKKEGWITITDLQKGLEEYAVKAHEKEYKEEDLNSGKIPLDDDPYQQLYLKNDLKEGTEIIFRYKKNDVNGKMIKDENGRLMIKDKDGKIWKMKDILEDEGGYIKPALTKEAEEKLKKEGKISTEDFRTWLAERDNFRHDDGNLVYTSEALKSRDFKGKEDPYQIFLEKFEYKKGDKVLYGGKDEQKEGTVDEEEIDGKNRLTVKDAEGKLVTLFDVLNGKEGFIKRKIEEEASAGAGEGGGVNEKITEATRAIGRTPYPDEMKIITDGGSTEDVVKYIKEKFKESVSKAAISAVTKEELSKSKTPAEAQRGMIMLDSLQDFEIALNVVGIKDEGERKKIIEPQRVKHDIAVKYKATPVYVIQLVREAEGNYSPHIMVLIKNIPEGMTEEQQNKMYQEMQEAKVG